MLSCSDSSELMKLQPTILKFTQMLASVLKLDAEVVDENLVRVAGTGRYSRCLGEKPHTGSGIFQHILETHQEKVVDSAAQDPVCADCPNKSDCQETAFLGVPIMVAERCIGVISIVAFDEASRTRIKENVALFSDYIRHISQIFVAKIADSRHAKSPVDTVLVNLIENMDQGVLVLDKQNRVKFGNKPALKHLEITEDELEHSQVDIRPIYLDNNLKGYQQHIIAFGKEEKLLVGQFHEANNNQLFLMAFHQNKSTTTISGHLQSRVDKVIGESEKMRQLKVLLSRISKSPSSVLISGESGTGKDVIAHAIHDLSDRAEHPFIAINCAAIPEQLLESELFGYEKGAFTGASAKGNKGLIQAANKGTLFLDEIGDMPLKLQAKLLRVLEERRVMSIGSNKSTYVDIRVISATNKNFPELIASNEFREDLYYRLNVIPIHLPALKDRHGDVELFIQHFLELHTRRIGVPYPGMTETVMSRLKAYHWPGNIRELSNLIEYLVNIVPEGDMIDEDLLPPYFTKVEVQTKAETPSVLDTGNMSLEEMERLKIEECLGRLKNRNLVAQELGIGIATLYRKIKKYQL
ncbi:putative sigma-54-dependent transcriptional regulator YgeV [Shewanella sp. NFH-SH190041]|nr:putative sigma-54-dependent transcriptional regulator YgeV [Shewanella sp. NFH-SH190041]